MLVFVIVLYKPEKHARFAMPMCRTPARCSCKVSQPLWRLYGVNAPTNVSTDITIEALHRNHFWSQWNASSYFAWIHHLVHACVHVYVCTACFGFHSMRNGSVINTLQIRNWTERAFGEKTNQISWLVVAPAIVTMHQPSLSYMPCQPCQCECTLSRPSTIVRSEGDLQGWLVHSTR